MAYAAKVLFAVVLEIVLWCNNLDCPIVRNDNISHIDPRCILFPRNRYHTAFASRCRQSGLRMSLKTSHKLAKIVCGIILIILSGDIETNPGPRNRYPCTLCQKRGRCSQKAIKCSRCEKRPHLHCSDLTPKQYNKLDKCKWFCHRCLLHELPFTSCNHLNFLSNCNVTAGNLNDSTAVANSSLTRPVGSTCKQDSLHNSSKIVFKVFSANVRSLLPLIDEISLLIKTQKPTIITLSETWLDLSVPDDIVNIEGYTLLRADRNRHGGGLLTYISRDLQGSCMRNFYTIRLSFIRS